MREITDDEIRDYRKHGVVYLPDLVDSTWLAEMETAFTDEMFAVADGLSHLDLVSTAELMSELGIQLLADDTARPTGRFWVRTFNWRSFPAVAKLALEPPMPEAIARLMGSSRLNFYGEQLFLKEAGSIHRSAFHQDAPYFHITGE